MPICAATLIRSLSSTTAAKDSVVMAEVFRSGYGVEGLSPPRPHVEFQTGVRNGFRHWSALVA